jgi:hypothetical protein
VKGSSTDGRCSIKMETLSYVKDEHLDLTLKGPSSIFPNPKLF